MPAGGAFDWSGPISKKTPINLTLTLAIIGNIRAQSMLLGWDCVRKRRHLPSLTGTRARRLGLDCELLRLTLVPKRYEHPSLKTIWRIWYRRSQSESECRTRYAPVFSISHSSRNNHDLRRFTSGGMKGMLVNFSRRPYPPCAVAALMCMTSTVSAAPIRPSFSSPAISSVEQVRYRDQCRYWKNGHRAEENRQGWYHGYRGHRDHRRGYRRHSDGFWYPPAALGAGAIIGGALAPHASMSSRHVRWCTDRYKTYRASDNTYALRMVVRAICRSPYY